MNRLGMCMCGSFAALRAEPQDREPIVLLMASSFKWLPSLALIAPIDCNRLIADLCPI
jgi:hypothetical protein